MNNSGKSTLKRFNFNLDAALFVLMAVAVIELVLYRFLGNMGFYVGVGTTGVRAGIANCSIFAMLLVGVLSAILLFWAMARIVNHPDISGIWWRGVLIFVSPLFLLSVFWSVWTPLSNWLLMASLVTVEFTVLLLCVLSIIRPVSFGMKRFFGVVAIVMLVGTAKWLTLDFFNVNRLDRWGAFLLDAFEVAQFFMLLLPIGAFLLFVAGTPEALLAALRRPHWPALISSTAAAAAVLALVTLIQQLTGEGDLVDAGQYVMRVFYRTIGLKMAWPLAPVMTAVSVFFLGYTTLFLMMGTRYRPRLKGEREAGAGLALIFLAGLQPFTVYQLAMSLLGVLLLVIGVAEQPLELESRESLHDLQEDLSD
ncbi:MAG: hypothetical protein JXX14_17055 [Deltaproteobacteria bacterium]|nr:hypothetical protein [Deltaproteobacteria bacterium]